MALSVKCFYCKGNIDLKQKYDGSFVYDKKHYCHCHCFTEHKTSLKKGKKKTRIRKPEKDTKKANNE